MHMYIYYIVTYVSLLYNTLLLCWGYSATLHPRIMRSLQLCGFSVLVLMVGTRQDVHADSGRITIMYSWVFPFPTIISSLKNAMLPMTTLCTGSSCWSKLLRPNYVDSVPIIQFTWSNPFGLKHVVSSCWMFSWMLLDLPYPLESNVILHVVAWIQHMLFQPRIDSEYIVPKIAKACMTLNICQRLQVPYVPSWFYFPAFKRNLKVSKDANLGSHCNGASLDTLRATYVSTQNTQQDSFA